MDPSLSLAFVGIFEICGMRYREKGKFPHIPYFFPPPDSSVQFF
jgi:hypothetical protein